MISGGMEMEHCQLPTSRALFNRVTVRGEWDLNPQLLN